LVKEKVALLLLM
jgi:RES domain-containing protein